MATAGSLSLVLTADSSQLRRELGQLQRESLFAAEAIRNIFSAETLQGAGIQVLTASTISLIDQIQQMNGELSLTTALVSSLKDGFASLIALPIPDFQAEALDALGLGQATQAIEILSLLSTGLKAVAIPVRIAQSGLELLGNALETFRTNLKLLSFVLEDIAARVRAAGVIFGPIADLLDSASKATDRFSQTAEGARNGVDSAWVSVGRLGERLKKYTGAAESFQSALADLGDAAILFNGFKDASALVDQFFGSLQDNFNSAKGAQTLGNRLELVSTAAGGAREDLSFLKKTTNDLGINFHAAAEGFTQFSTATNLAGLSAEQTKDTFAAVSQATSVMGLSADETQGVFLALRQSISSGNLQLEELNQIAEKVPGAFQAAAAALGVTTSEVKGLISSGKVDSAEFLPKFAEQLKVFTDAGLVDAMNSGEAAVNRFSNALGEFQVAAGQAWLDVGTPALNTFAKALSFAAENEEAFSTVIDALLVASVIRGIGAVKQFTTSMVALSSGAGKGNLVFELFGKQIQTNVAQIGKLAAQAALTYAAVMLFYRVVDRAKDSAEGTRSAIASLDKSLQELSNSSQKSGNALKSALPEDPPPLDWLDKAVKGLKDAEEGGNLFGKAIRVATQFTPAGLGLELNKLVNFIKTGNYEIVTASEKALNDQLVAIGDFSSRAQEILDKSFEFRQTAKNSGGALAELKEVELALKQIEQQRLKADPKDEKTLSRLGEEEAELLKRYGDAQKEVTANQSALNTALNQAKQELQNLDPAKLGTKGYEQAKQQIETQINLLEKEKVKFDELTKKAEVTAESITTNFEKASTSLDRGFSDAQAKIEEALASGEISQEEYQQRQLDSEKKYLEDRLKLNRDTAEKLKAELDRNAKLKAIDPSKATLTTEKEEEYQKQLQQIEVDTAKTRIDLAKNTQATKADLQEQELNTIRENQAEAEAILQRTENERIAAIKQRQMTGQISEEEANREIEAAQKASILAQIQAEKDKLTQVAELRAQGKKTAQEAAAEEREILNNLSDLNLQRVEAELKARQEANNQIIKDFEDGLRQAEAAIRQSQNSRQQAISTNQLQGASPEETAQQEVEAQRQTIEQTLALKQKEFAGIQQQRARGVRSAKQAAALEAQLLQEIGDLKVQQLQNEIDAQQALLGAIGARAQEEIQLAETTEAQKIAGIKDAQAARIVTEEEAAKQIAAINLENANETLRIKEAELEETKAQRRSGELSIEEAADQEKQLIGEVAQLRQQVADAEIAEQERIKQAKLTAFDEEMAAAQAAAEVVNDQRELEKQALQNQSNLISAQTGLLQAQTQLRQQRLQFQIEEAEQSGNATQAEALKKQLLNEQIRAQEQQFKIDLEQMKIQQEQNRLELVSTQTNAEIAATEADINLQKAIASGASQQELMALTNLLSLRNQQLEAINGQIANQSKLNSLEQQALRTQQQMNREKLSQQKITAQTAAVTASSSSSSSGSASFSGGGGSPVNAAASMAGMGGMGGGQKGLSLTAAADKMMGLAMSQGTLADVFNASNIGLKMKLNDDFGSGFIRGNIGGGNSEIAGKLDQLIAATRSSAGRPNLSISNVNDLGMAGQIYGDISRDSFRSAGL